MLALEIEWLTGVCVARRSPAESAPEWPVQPDRVFSALVATWSARGERSAERMALEWLEALSPPKIEAAEASVRDVATAFVPPNDSGPADIRSLPTLRRRQPRQFPASIIMSEAGVPHMRLVWVESAQTGVLDALQLLARDTAYIGHSSSFVRCRFVEEGVITPLYEPTSARAAPYAGRLRELETLHERNMRGGTGARPKPGLVINISSEPTKLEPSSSVFGRHWFVLEHAEGERPDIRAIARTARTMRDAVMSAFPGTIPEWLSGHSSDGAPSMSPHLAVLPLANVGHRWSDGRLIGLALVLPRKIEDTWEENASPSVFQAKRTFERTMATLSSTQNGGGDSSIALKLGRDGVWRLRPANSDLQSLSPSRYCKSARCWSTATPIALDRHLKSVGEMRDAEAKYSVAESFERIGLPAPTSVRLHKHAAINGAPSAWPPNGAPAWTGWARPGSLSGRQLFHATVSFAEPVKGPIVVGAGRFFGLGLCLPIDGGNEA
jgi:CRISPR-associated protein Csb2